MDESLGEDTLTLQHHYKQTKLSLKRLGRVNVIATIDHCTHVTIRILNIVTEKSPTELEGPN